MEQEPNLVVTIYSDLIFNPVLLHSPRRMLTTVNRPELLLYQHELSDKTSGFSD